MVLELTGGVAAVFIGFVLPPMLHFKLGTLDAAIWRNPPAQRWAACKEFGLSIYVMCMGILAMVVTVIFVGAGEVASARAWRAGVVASTRAALCTTSTTPHTARALLTRSHPHARSHTHTTRTHAEVVMGGHGPHDSFNHVNATGVEGGLAGGH